MIPLSPTLIIGYSQGLKQNKKPFLLSNQAFSTLENAYSWRERVKKREGLKLLGRLRRTFTALSLGNSGASPWTINTIYSTLVPPIVPEADSEIEPGSVLITIGAITFTDISPTLSSPNGTLVSNTVGNSGTINYITGVVVLTHTAGAGVATTISFNYFPSLPVMGLPSREIPSINDEQLIAFDTKYAYTYSGTGFIELPSVLPVTWNATDSDFFWATNYRGVLPSDRLFFVTNFINDVNNPMRYYDGATWSAPFQPIIADVPESGAQSLLYQARILIPYYGRLLALNTWEGTTAGGNVGAINLFSRCRYSQIGSPIAVDAWRSDQFGKGGFIDAPTNEEIMSASFFKNTLIVHFERTTWQLRYVGEYGIPFIWERISSDFGSESTFSDVLFDKGVLTVGDRAITISSGIDVQRIDADIPDAVFDYRNAQNGTKRVHGIRDFKRELVFWCYSDAQLQRKFPNRVQVYNYQNNTFAKFRDNVTAFGIFQPSDSITWDRTDILWDDEGVTWDDTEAQSQFPFIVSGNQQGFVHYYGYRTPDDESLSVSGVDLTTTPITLNIKDHNLENGEIIFLSGLLFVNGSGVPVSTDLNNNLYQSIRVTDDSIFITKWDPVSQIYVNDFDFTPVPSSTYVGGGAISLMPKLIVATKDFNPYQDKSLQMQISYIDFLMERTDNAKMTVELFVNTSLSVKGNMLIGNKEMETFTNSPFYVPDSDIAWHRFFASVYGQYIRVIMTYDDDLMNDITTHQETWALNAMNLWSRPAGKFPF